MGGGEEGHWPKRTDSLSSVKIKNKRVENASEFSGQVHNRALAKGGATRRVVPKKNFDFCARLYVPDTCFDYGSPDQ